MGRVRKAPEMQNAVRIIVGRVDCMNSDMNLDSRTVLVTGATGFIGQRLCAALVHAGVRVIALSRSEVGVDIETHHWNMAEVPSIPSMSQVDTIFHLAGKAHALSENPRDESDYFAINTEGTRNLLQAAKQAGVRRFVFFSSVKASGEGGMECLNESAGSIPETPYGKSKLEAERLVLQEGYVPEPVVLRLSMVYGSTRKGNLPRMIETVARGRFPPLPEMGNRRSMVHVEDVVQAALLASARPEAVGNVYIVTDGHAYSTRQMYESICEALHRRVPAWNIPLGAMKLLASIGDGIGRVRGQRFMFDSDVLGKLTDSAWYSSEKISRDLGFHPRYHLKGSLPEIVRFLECL